MKGPLLQQIVLNGIIVVQVSKQYKIIKLMTLTTTHLCILTYLIKVNYVMIIKIFSLHN